MARQKFERGRGPQLGKAADVTAFIGAMKGVRKKQAVDEAASSERAGKKLDKAIKGITDRIKKERSPRPKLKLPPPSKRRKPAPNPTAGVWKQV